MAKSKKETKLTAKGRKSIVKKAAKSTDDVGKSKSKREPIRSSRAAEKQTKNSPKAKSKTNGGITTGPTLKQAGIQPKSKSRASRAKNMSSKTVEDKRRQATARETTKKANESKGSFGKKKTPTGPITASEVAKGGQNRRGRAKQGGYQATGSRNQQTASLDDYISAMAGRTGDQFVRGAGDAGTQNPQVPMRRTPPPQAPRPQAPQPYRGGQRPQPGGYSASGGVYGDGPRQPQHPQGRGQAPPQRSYQPQGPPVPQGGQQQQPNPGYLPPGGLYHPGHLGPQDWPQPTRQGARRDARNPPMSQMMPKMQQTGNPAPGRQTRVTNGFSQEPIISVTPQDVYNAINVLSKVPVLRQIGEAAGSISTQGARRDARNQDPRRR